jgi:CheY-like chemotaxis protein
VAAQRRPDVVVVDLLMPRVDGFEFLRRFRATRRGRATPVVVLTGKDLVRKEKELLAAMAQGIVAKGAGSVQALLAEISMALTPGDTHSPTDAHTRIGRAEKHQSALKPDTSAKQRGQAQ